MLYETLNKIAKYRSVLYIETDTETILAIGDNVKKILSEYYNYNIVYYIKNNHQSLYVVNEFEKENIQLPTITHLYDCDNNYYLDMPMLPYFGDNTTFKYINKSYSLEFIVDLDKYNILKNTKCTNFAYLTYDTNLLTFDYYKYFTDLYKNSNEKAKFGAYKYITESLFISRYNETCNIPITNKVLQHFKDIVYVFGDYNQLLEDIEELIKMGCVTFKHIK